MKISIKDITSLPDATKKFPGSFELKDISYLGDNFSVTDTQPFEVILSMKGLKSLLVSLDTRVDMVGGCNRCLTDVPFSVDVSFSQELELADGAVVYDEEEGPYSFVSDEFLDIDEIILNEILVNFPAKILCQDDCKGLCPTCGTNLNLGSCDCDNTVLDPRMAQFLDVFNSFKEVK